MEAGPGGCGCWALALSLFQAWAVCQAGSRGTRSRPACAVGAGTPCAGLGRGSAEAGSWPAGLMQDCQDPRTPSSGQLCVLGKHARARPPQWVGSYRCGGRGPGSGLS